MEDVFDDDPAMDTPENRELSSLRAALYKEREAWATQNDECLLAKSKTVAEKYKIFTDILHEGLVNSYCHGHEFLMPLGQENVGYGFGLMRATLSMMGATTHSYMGDWWPSSADNIPDKLGQFKKYADWIRRMRAALIDLAQAQAAIILANNHNYKGEVKALQ